MVHHRHYQGLVVVVVVVMVATQIATICLFPGPAIMSTKSALLQEHVASRLPNSKARHAFTLQKQSRDIHTQTSARTPKGSRKDDDEDGMFTALNTVELVEIALEQADSPEPVHLYREGKPWVPAARDVALVTDILFPSDPPGDKGAARNTAALFFERIYCDKNNIACSHPPGSHQAPPELLLPDGKIPTFTDPSGFVYPLFTNPTNEPVCILELRVWFHSHGIPRYPSTWALPFHVDGIPRYPPSWSDTLESGPSPSPLGTTPSGNPSEGRSSVSRNPDAAKLPPLMSFAEAKALPARRAGVYTIREVYAIVGVGKFFSRRAAADHVVKNPRAVCRGPFASGLAAHRWMTTEGN